MIEGLLQQRHLKGWRWRRDSPGKPGPRLLKLQHSEEFSTATRSISQLDAWYRGLDISIQAYRVGLRPLAPEHDGCR